MIIRNFEYLLALARERHFSRAAASCHVSQPTLSGGIKQLERDMDVQIVKRGRTFEGFTTEGERVLAWAQQMLDDCLRLKQELSTFRESSMQGAFHIGVLPTTAPLGSTLSVLFAEQAPGLELSITTGNAAELTNLVRDGKLDVALTYTEDSSNEGLSTHLLYCEHMLFFTAQEQTPTSRLTLDEVLEHPLCLLSNGLPRALAEHLKTAPRVLLTDSPVVLAAHVRSGKWSTVLPQSLAGSLSNSPSLKALPLYRNPAAQAQVGFLTQRFDPTPAPLHAFMELAHSSKGVDAIREMLEVHLPYMPAEKKRRSR